MANWESIVQEYSNAIKNEIGAFNLDDDITPEMAGDHPSKTIRIRRLHNDNVFPFNAMMFIKWYNQEKREDPLTREPLGYLQKRVKFKMECIKYVEDHGEHGDAAYSDENAKNQLQTYLKGGDASSITLRMLVSLHTLNISRCIHMTSNIDEVCKILDQRCSKSGKGFMIRISSKDPFTESNIMKNASVITFSRLMNSEYSHLRFILIEGIGWYHLLIDAIKDGSASKSLLFLQNQKHKSPVCVTVIDLIEYVRTGWHLEIEDLILVDDEDLSDK